MGVPVVHLITDRALCADLPARVRAALAGLPPGRAAVHLREKGLPGRALVGLARELLAACREAGQLLVVNDRADVALACGADGVHLPAAGLPPAEARRLLGPEMHIGVSCHSERDVSRALAGGADWATFGPILDTPSKHAYGPPLGFEALARASRLGLPLVALGGIDPSSAAAAAAARAAAVGVIRAWLLGPDPARVVAALAAALP